MDDLYTEYPEVVAGLKPNKIISSDKKKNFVKLRKDKFADIRKLW